MRPPDFDLLLEDLESRGEADAIDSRFMFQLLLSSREAVQVARISEAERKKVLQTAWKRLSGGDRAGLLAHLDHFEEAGWISKKEKHQLMKDAGFKRFVFF